LISRKNRNKKKVTKIDLIFRDKTKVEKYFLTILIGILILVIIYILIFHRNKPTPEKTPTSDLNGISDITEITTESILEEGLDSYSVSKSYDTIVASNTNYITFWGDSFITDISKDGKTVPAYLSVLTEKTVYNCGVSGETLRTVAAKQGGFPMLVQPFIIPKDETPVDITISSLDNTDLNLSFEQNGGLNPCVIADIEGTINQVINDDGTEKLTFTRSTSGVEKQVLKPTVILTRGMLQQRENLMVVYLGNKSAYNDINETLSIYRNMIDYLSPARKEYLIVGPVTGSEDENREFDKAMTLEFGRNYINMREYLYKYALEELKLTPTDDDNQKISEGIVPSSIYDNNSLTDKGNLAAANLIFERMKELGMF